MVRVRVRLSLVDGRVCNGISGRVLRPLERRGLGESVSVGVSGRVRMRVSNDEDEYQAGLRLGMNIRAKFIQTDSHSHT